MCWCCKSPSLTGPPFGGLHAASTPRIICVRNVKVGIRTAALFSAASPPGCARQLRLYLPAEANPTYAAATDIVFSWLAERASRAATSAITMTEVLVAPYRSLDE